MLFGAGVSVPAGDDAQEMSCARQGGAEGTVGGSSSRHSLKQLYPCSKKIYGISIVNLKISAGTRTLTVKFTQT